MEDYLARLLNLTSYISHSIIQFIGDLVFGNVERISCGPEPSFSGWRGRTLHSIDHPSRRETSMFPDYSDSITEVNRSRTVVLCRAKLFICRGLMFGLKLGAKFVAAGFKRGHFYIKGLKVRAQGFIRRLRRTLQGSTEDIGWLQRDEGLPPVEDGTARFKEILCDVRYFMASVERNSWELKQYIEELYWGSGKRVLLLGHSKGGIDAAAALSIYWPDLKEKVAGLALVQSPYGGSPLASDILREGQIADKEARRIMEFIICKLIKGDMRALEDLTYEKRMDFIATHRLPYEHVPLISFHTEASTAPGVLATMSHIAHAELPFLPLPHFLSEAYYADSSLANRKVPVVIPLSAAMAVSAFHLRLRYGEKSDGLVARRDAEVPGSVAVRLDRKLDHAWMVYSSMKKDEVEADASEMCEALLTMLVEIGRMRKKSE
ncbi:hypothetical protein ACMD2_04058 [Ananas comosus]|uniref:Uncharacterized protein n=1 Tax=Ananas comosus TaxID=4615 RepID=A0A199W6M1_ANACO|nr:hypothetical protein ACMD2_04058 [Ananas comosus]